MKNLPLKGILGPWHPPSVSASPAPELSWLSSHYNILSHYRLPLSHEQSSSLDSTSEGVWLIDRGFACLPRVNPQCQNE